jgi:membrane associated rhomboid family serine protease
MIPYRDTIPCMNTPWVTWSLIVLNFGIFLAVCFLPEKPLTHLFQFYGLVPARYASPEWAAWAGLPANDYAPLVTHMFIHGSWLHVILNMWMLWIFGDNVEDRMGALRFIAFYLFCGLVAGGLQIFANPEATTPVVAHRARWRASWAPITSCILTHALSFGCFSCPCFSRCRQLPFWGYG